MVVRHKKSAEPLIKEIIKANIGELSQEQDGYAVFRDGETDNFVGDEAYRYLDTNALYRGEKLYIVHTRTKTAGATGIDGLHLQPLSGNFYYAHNGMVRKYQNVLRHSDSYYFFKHLIRKYKGEISYDIVREHVTETGFSGKGILYDKSRDMVYLFVNQQSYMTVLDGALTFTSYEPVLKKTIYDTRKMLGFAYYSNKRTEDFRGIVATVTLDDCFMRFERGKVVEQRKMEGTYAGYYGTWYTKDSLFEEGEDEEDRGFGETGSIIKRSS